MCGICGIINFNEAVVNDVGINSMLTVMKHRGPDDEGVYLHGQVGFGFVRLSIIDLSNAGHQPMKSEDERYVIVFNGEIFNYIEIREDLKALGYIFKTHTDTEVVIAAYKEWGQECQNKFNGMWAFAIYDRLQKVIFISRDRYGIKPFYYYMDQDFFVFASEIPPILKFLPFQSSPNYQSIFDYLVFNRTDQTEETFFNGIKKLQHGHCINIYFGSEKSDQKFDIRKWYDIRHEISIQSGIQFKSSDFRKLFADAISLRLRSDVPIGVCLSGGLDSSSIVSILLNDFNKNDLKTFSAVYEKGDFGDESEFIHLYDNELQNMYFITPDSNSLLKDVEAFVKAQAEPIPSTSPYAQFKVMELASNKVVVTLDGQGADEMLGGYHYFFGFYFKDLLKHLKAVTLIREVFCYIKIHRSLIGVKSFLYFLLPKKIKTKVRVSEKGYILPEFVKKYKNKNAIADNLYGSSGLQEALINHFEYKLEHLLKWEDRNSMWFSIEARVPFLDHRLVEKTLSLPGNEMIRKGMTKHILRESMRGILPERIRVRKDKIGFGTPQDEWFRTPKLHALVQNILLSESFAKRGIIDVGKAKSLFHQHMNREINISKEIWKWLHLELWFREFIDPSINISDANIN